MGKCPICESDCTCQIGNPRYEGGLEDIEFRDVIISCKSCGNSGHYLATKQINNS